MFFMLIFLFIFFSLLISYKSTFNIFIFLKSKVFEKEIMFSFKK